MTKEIKILIIGFGSIGTRHYKNLKKLGYLNICVFDPYNKKVKSVKHVNNIDLKTLKDFDVAFICNPNNFHIKTALKCAKAGLHLFIEKPLSHNINGLDELIKLSKNKKLITLVGCNMRFHPCLKYIKDYLSNNKLGQVYSINHEFGYYLPYWRPKQDYRKNYAAKKSTGGGIILDDIHEFDLLFWLNNFTKLEKSTFYYNKVSDLKIETEDLCIASFKFKNKVHGLVKCDYIQKSYTRNCKVVGEQGNLEWDFNNNQVWLKTNKSKKKVFEKKNFDFNQVYIDEVKYFFDCIKNNKQSFNDVKLASKLLKVCLKR